MEYNKKTDVNINFEEGDVYNISVHGGKYSHHLSVNTRDGDSVNLKFNSDDALRKFVGMALTAAYNNEWQNEYSSNYTYAADQHITLDALKMWEMSHSEHEAAREQYEREEGIN